MYQTDLTNYHKSYFLPLGRADNFGVNCFYLNIADTGIILDCGIHPRIKGINAIPDFSLLNDKPVDFVLISHAHQDHIGSLPFLVRQFPHVRVLMTHATLAIARLMLKNATAILQKRLDETLTPYSFDELDMLLKSVITFNYEEKFELKGRHNFEQRIYGRFYDAGHILGSAGILIESENENVFYSGDIKLSEQTLLEGAKLPDKKINTLILEATYGSTDTNLIGTRESEIKRFTDSINKVLAENGSILCPVFALGKTQEILSLIYELMETKKIPETAIYTGGLGRGISHVYDRYKFTLWKRNKPYSLKTIPQENLYRIKRLEHFKRYPGIVLASSGMMVNDTVSFELSKFWFKFNNFAIFPVGYMDPETPGYLVLNAKKNSDISFSEEGPVYKVNCNIESFRFSAHSTREELIQIINKLNPDRVILMHGDEEAVDWMGYEILSSNKNIKVNLAEGFKKIIL